MSIRNLSRVLLCALTLTFLASTIQAQEYPPELQDKFRKAPVVTTKVQPQDKKDKRFFKPYGRGFILSSAVFWGGSAADIISTGDGQELNPLLRNEHGGLSRGKAIAVTAGYYAFTLLIEKKHPKLASVLRFIGGAVRVGLALRNMRQ